MFQEDKNNPPNSPRGLANGILKDLIFQVFMVISLIITVFVALSLQSWWPFAGWFVVVLAFGLWLGT